MHEHPVGLPRRKRVGQRQGKHRGHAQEDRLPQVAESKQGESRSEHHGKLPPQKAAEPQRGQDMGRAQPIVHTPGASVENRR